MDRDPVPQKLSRREFLKLGGGASAGFFAWLLTGCKVPDHSTNTPIVSPGLYKTATPVPGNEIDQSLHDASKQAATSEQVSYLQQNQREPITMILEKLEGQVTVVGLGEMHNELDMELFANNVINQAVEKNLIQFLALEIDNTNQGDVDKFLHTGDISQNLQKILNQHNSGYRQILESARNHKLKVVCVDNHQNSERRDDYMSKTILRYLDSHQGSKGIFYGGSGHMITRFDILAGELGKRYYSVLQLNRRDSDSKDTVYNAMLQTGIKQPVGIDNVADSPFSKATYGHPYELWSEYGRITDALVLLPPSK